MLARHARRAFENKIGIPVLRARSALRNRAALCTVGRAREARDVRWRTQELHPVARHHTDAVRPPQRPPYSSTGIYAACIIEHERTRAGGVGATHGPNLIFSAFRKVAPINPQPAPPWCATFPPCTAHVLSTPCHLTRNIVRVGLPITPSCIIYPQTCHYPVPSDCLQLGETSIQTFVPSKHQSGPDLFTSTMVEYGTNPAADARPWAQTLLATSMWGSRQSSGPPWPAGTADTASMAVLDRAEHPCTTTGTLPSRPASIMAYR